MTITFRELVPAKFAEDSQTAQYTADNCTAIIDKFTVTNVSGGNETIGVNLVQSGGSAGASNLIVERQIAPGKTYTFPEIVGQTLGSGSFISTIASAASALTIRAGGREVTD